MASAQTRRMAHKPIPLRAVGRLKSGWEGRWAVGHDWRNWLNAAVKA